jgi:hypothetical protein
MVDIAEGCAPAALIQAFVGTDSYLGILLVKQDGKWQELARGMGLSLLSATTNGYSDLAAIFRTDDAALTEACGSGERVQEAQIIKWDGQQYRQQKSFNSCKNASDWTELQSQLVDLSGDYQKPRFCADRRIAFSIRAGVEVFAGTSDVSWCGEDAPLVIVADDEAFFSGADFQNIVRQVGTQVLPDECPSARRVLLTGVAKASRETVYSGYAEKSTDWLIVTTKTEVEQSRSMPVVRLKLVVLWDGTAAAWTKITVKSDAVSELSSRVTRELGEIGPGFVAIHEDVSPETGDVTFTKAFLGPTISALSDKKLTYRFREQRAGLFRGAYLLAVSPVGDFVWPFSLEVTAPGRIEETNGERTDDSTVRWNAEAANLRGADVWSVRSNGLSLIGLKKGSDLAGVSWLSPERAIVGVAAVLVLMLLASPLARRRARAWRFGAADQSKPPEQEDS